MLRRHQKIFHSGKRENPHIALVVAKSDDIPVSALADDVIGVNGARHKGGFLQGAVVKGERAARAKRVKNGLKKVRVDGFGAVGNEGDFRVQKRCVNRDFFGQTRRDFFEHGTQLNFERRVSVLFEERIQNGDGKRFAFSERDALD